MLMRQQVRCMQRRDFLKLSALGSLGLGLEPFHLNATAAGGDAQDPHRRRRLRHRLHPLHGGAHRQAAAEAPATCPPRRPIARPASSRWFRSCAPLDVEPLAQESFIASTRQTQSWEEVLLVGRRHRRVRRQHAEPAGDLESAGHRRHPQAGVGPRHRPRRRERGIALLVRGRHDGFPAEGADDGQVPGIPEGQPLSALRSRAGPAAAVSAS